MVVSAPKGVIVPLLTAVTTGTGTAIVFPIKSKNPRIHVRGAGTIASGTVILEESNDPTYSGTWSQLASVDASTLTGGAEQVYHILGTINACRARVSANIVGGGTVTVEAVSD